MNINYCKNDNDVCHSFKAVAHTSPCAYIYVLCHKESLVQVSLCFQTYLNLGECCALWGERELSGRVLARAGIGRAELAVR